MVFHRVRILVAAFALVLVPAGQVNASTMTVDYTISVEGEGPYEFSIPWIGESHWFLDGVEVSGFVTDSETGLTSGLLSLSEGETYSLQIQLIGDETPLPALAAPDTVTLTTVPEPATLLLIGFALAGLAIAARRQARRDAAARCQI